MDEKKTVEAEETTASEEPSEDETPTPEVPLNRAERRHGAAADQLDDRPVRGNRGFGAGPFQQGGPSNKRTRGHRKTG